MADTPYWTQQDAHWSLRHAIRVGRLDFVKLWSDRVREINLPSKDPDPLTIAASARHPDPLIVAYLLFGRGEDPVAVNRNGTHPVEYLHRTAAHVNFFNPYRETLKSIEAMIQYAQETNGANLPGQDAKGQGKRENSTQFDRVLGALGSPWLRLAAMALVMSVPTNRMRDALGDTKASPTEMSPKTATAAPADATDQKHPAAPPQGAYNIPLPYNNGRWLYFPR